jgi:hypothetical protein
MLIKELYEMSWTPMKRIHSLHENEDSNNLANSFLSILHHGNFFILYTLVFHEKFQKFLFQKLIL